MVLEELHQCVVWGAEERPIRCLGGFRDLGLEGIHVGLGSEFAGLPRLHVGFPRGLLRVLGGFGLLLVGPLQGLR